MTTRCPPGSRARPRPTRSGPRRGAIAHARRPALYAGGGVVHAAAHAELLALAEAGGGLPVTTTLMALGAFPAGDPRWLGMLGMHGCRTANWAVDECDVLVAIGARFDDRVTGRLDQFAPAAKTVIHLDVDPAEIGKLRRPDVALVGDARASLAALTHEVRARRPDPARLTEWRGVLDRWRSAETTAPPDGGRTARPRRSTRSRRGRAATRSSRPTSASTRCGRPSACASTARAGGSPAAASARWASACPRRSARRSRPGPAVVCVTGDGSLLMNVQELVTAAHEALPIKVVLVDDGALGMVRQQQDMSGAAGARRSTCAAPDWPVCRGVRNRWATSVGEDAGTRRRADGHARGAGRRSCGWRSAGGRLLPMFMPGAAARDMIGANVNCGIEGGLEGVVTSRSRGRFEATPPATRPHRPRTDTLLPHPAGLTFARAAATSAACATRRRAGWCRR